MGKKISELTEASSMGSANYFPVVIDGVTKKVEFETIKEEVADDLGSVTSVAGRTGDVTLSKSDVGLGYVDNTPDANKPISSAMQTALNAKQDSLTFDSTPTSGSSNPVTSDGIFSALSNVSGVSADLKAALLQLASKVAYIDGNGQDYYDDLYDALYAVTAITLNTNSLTINTIGGTSQLTATTVPAGATVTWVSSDTSVATVDSNGLVTSVAYGSATITATAGNVSATCSVVVAQATVTGISAVYTQSGTVYDTDSLSDLTSDLVVTATWSNGTTSTVSSNDYVLTGTLSTGTSTITVSYGGQTDTFTVTVTAAPTLTSISAAYTQSGTVYDTDSLSDLTSDLVVTATYSDSSTAVISSANYTLSGTLAEGTSTITVSYGGQTDTFTVTVTSSAITIIPFTDANTGLGSVSETSSYPYVTNSVVTRLHCLGEDCLGYEVTPGSSITITIESEYTDWYLGLQFFNETAYNCFAAQTSASSSDKQDGGWRDFSSLSFTITVPSTINSVATKTLWIVGKRGSGGTTAITAASITKITITPNS